MKKYDKIINYYKVKYIGEPNDDIIIEEKLDGGNIRFTYDGNKLIFGTRNMEFRNENEENKMFKNVFNYIRNKLNENEYKIAGYIFYGEGMVKHTINYNWDKIPKFIAFDIYDISKNKYLNYKEKVNILSELGLSIAPIIKVCKLKDLNINKIEIPKSLYYDGLAEGIVIKNYKRQIFIKKVRPQFKEENKKVFGGSYKKANDFTEYIINKYLTNARIDKIIYKIRDEKGISIDMPLMKYLPNTIMKDVIEEEWDNIYKQGIKRNAKIDFKKLHKLTIERCKARLLFIIHNKNY